MSQFVTGIQCFKGLWVAIFLAFQATAQDYPVFYRTFEFSEILEASKNEVFFEKHPTYRFVLELLNPPGQAPQIPARRLKVPLAKEFSELRVEAERELFTEVERSTKVLLDRQARALGNLADERCQDDPRRLLAMNNADIYMQNFPVRQIKIRKSSFAPGEGLRNIIFINVQDCFGLKEEAWLPRVAERDAYGPESPAVLMNGKVMSEAEAKVIYLNNELKRFASRGIKKVDILRDGRTGRLFLEEFRD